MMAERHDSLDEAPSDQALVLRTRTGETDAFGQLVRRHQASVFNVCYRMCGNRGEAEDLAQETFIRAFRRLETFDPGRPFGPWIRRVAANLCYNHLGRRTPRLVPFEDWQQPLEPARPGNPEAILAAAEQAAAVRAAILALPPPYRAVIELRHFQGLSYQEIAEALDTSLSQVKSHLFRARKSLAQQLGKELT